jgi:uncharacterized phage protein (TIGR01671 family)
MREIKFRGISRESNKFVYGMLMYSCSDSGLVIVETANIPPTMQDPCGDTINVYHGIVQGSECQFTGIKDKNGKEIYEGDIVINDTGRYPHEIVYKGTAFQEKDTNIIYSASWEVVGNIHQHKHLLNEN